MHADSYRQPAALSLGRVMEKKSEFIAQLACAATEDAALAFLAGVRAQHRTAHHNVYAYLLREGARARYSDDGEPAKTAGLPVLAILQHAQLVNAVLVVTRYFGGTKLGTGGLVRAYTVAAQAAVDAAEVATVRRLVPFSLALPYALYDAAERLVRQSGARLRGGAEFGAQVRLCALLPAEAYPPLAATLRELLRGGEGLTCGEAYFAPW